MARLRPTLRCLTDDLQIRLGLLVDEANLDDFAGHSFLVTAREAIRSGRPLELVRNDHPPGVRWLEIEQTSPEWRGVVWQDDLDEDLFWLVAAGRHQADSGNDFWASLKRSRDLAAFQPTVDDRKRMELEGPAKQAAADRRSAKELVLRALDGQGVVFNDTIFGADVEVCAQSLDPDLTRVVVGVTIRGRVPQDVQVLILRALVPDGRGRLNDNWWPAIEDSPVEGDLVWEGAWHPAELRRLCR